MTKIQHELCLLFGRLPIIPAACGYVHISFHGMRELPLRSPSASPWNALHASARKLGCMQHPNRCPREALTSLLCILMP